MEYCQVTWQSFLSQWRVVWSHWKLNHWKRTVLVMDNVNLLSDPEMKLAAIRWHAVSVYCMTPDRGNEKLIRLSTLQLIGYDTYTKEIQAAGEQQRSFTTIIMQNVSENIWKKRFEGKTHTSSHIDSVSGLPRVLTAVVVLQQSNSRPCSWSNRRYHPHQSLPLT